MTSRVMTERELLLETVRRVDELAEHVADLHVRLGRMAVIVDADAGQHSRRLEFVSEQDAATVARLERYLALVTGDQWARS